GTVKVIICFRSCKIIERSLGYANDIITNKFCAFACPVFGMFDATFPFHHRPTFEIVLRELAEYFFEVNLPVAGRAISACAVEPTLVTAKCSLSPGGIKFRVLYMKCFDAFVIKVDVFDVIELLQYEVRWIVEQAGAGMTFYLLEEHFVCGAVEKVFAGMDLITYINTAFIEFVQNRQPSSREFRKTFFHQPFRTLRPGMKCMPEQGTAECGMRI